MLVEGAGGLLVRFDEDGGTLADVAALLDAPVLVVARAGLGTLNHTALTVEALRAPRPALPRRRDRLLAAPSPTSPRAATSTTSAYAGARARTLPEGAELAARRSSQARE